tara:strand:- start:693 stop:1688 length:996 start_codon:yes stop_codon:yes gene_type:complete
MATGGLMSKPPYLKNEEEKDTGITPYDVDSPESARKGMPSRLLSKQRTRFSKGDGVKPILLPGELDIPTAEEWEEMTAPDKNDLVWLNKKDLIRLRVLEKKDGLSEHGGKKLNTKEKKELKDLKKKDKEQEAPKKKAALGGYMDNFQIAEEEPLSRGKRALGGAAALEEKYDRRRAYRAFQEGDLVEDEIVEEPLMAPVGMEEPLIEDEIAADDLAMEDAESVLDTSMLSEEEEVVVDAAIEMYPELEAILPKMVATEFTEDELVEGPGTGTSDSIPALLSDGEFVFTAKAVKNIGIDKLRKMMAQAEEAYDAGMVNQEETAELAVDETIV